MSSKDNSATVEPDAQEDIGYPEGEPEGVDELTLDDWLEKVEFDVTGITTREYADIDKHRNEESKYMPMLLAKVVSKAPIGLGHVSKMETWQQLPFFGVVVPVFAKFSGHLKSLPSTIEGIEYALDDITPVQYETYRKKLLSNATVHEQAVTLTKVVKVCPSLSGGPANLNNWLSAPFYTVFVPARQGYAQAATVMLTNFLKRYGV